MPVKPSFRQLIVATLLATLVGCGKPAPTEFRLNSVELLKQEKLSLPAGEHFDESYQKEIGTILTSLFGTPDEPKFPMLLGEEDPAHEFISLENLQMAAGPVNSDQDGKPSGLYREHCAHCHGVTGCGAGPTAAFLNPYPRDFRLGKFKFKSTPLRQPPTDHDLETVLKNGIPGTAMPSFRTLPEEEIDALIDYVKYLTIRGQFERFLMAEVNGFEGEPIIDLSHLKKLSPTSGNAPEAEESVEAFEDRIYELVGDGLLDGIIYRWANRDRRASKIPSAPANVDPAHDEHAQLVDLGRQLFHTKGNCVQCHGDTGVGDGQLGNYDDWTNEWIKVPGVDVNSPATMSEFLAKGALPPRPVRPRNLHIPVFRGGSHPNDVYLRIANGIEGTPMPSSAALNSDEIWAIVAYVKALPFQEKLERVNRPVNQQALTK
jgi:mono/diheme cytochrome c family protein